MGQNCKRGGTPRRFGSRKRKDRKGPFEPWYLQACKRPQENGNKQQNNDNTETGSRSEPYKPPPEAGVWGWVRIANAAERREDSAAGSEKTGKVLSNRGICKPANAPRRTETDNEHNSTTYHYNHEKSF